MQPSSSLKFSLLLASFLSVLQALQPVLAVLGMLFGRGGSACLLGVRWFLQGASQACSYAYKRFVSPGSRFARKPAHVTFAFCEAPASKNLYRPHFEDLVLNAVAVELSVAGYACLQKKIENLIMDPNQPLLDRDQESALYLCLKRRHFTTAKWLLDHPKLTRHTCQKTYATHIFMTDRGPLIGHGSALLFALLHNYRECIEALLAKGACIEGKSELDLWAIEKLRAHAQRISVVKSKA